MSSDISEIICPKADCSYSSKSRVGVSIHHSKVHGEPLETSTNEEYGCPEEDCKQTFASEHGRDIHATKVHELRPEEPIKCPTCGRSFTTEPGMKAHHTVKHGESLNKPKGEIECPNSSCSQVFSSEMGVKVHHVKEHGESIARVRVECANCGETTTKIQSEAKRASIHFCDNDCKFEHKTGESSPFYNRIEVECFNCGKTLQKTPSQIRLSEKYFCDKTCGSEYRDTKIELACDYCGTEFRRTKRKAEQNEKNFCSPECHRSHIQENAEYPDPRDDPRLEEWREAVFDRDDYTCQDCEKRGGYLAAHHIERWSEAPEKRFNVPNGVTLCRNCHYLRHKRAGDPYANLINNPPKAEQERADKATLHDFL